MTYTERMTARARLVRIGTVLTTIVVANNSAFAQTLTWLGVLQQGNSSAATAVSANGTVVVGWAKSASGFPHAFRWTAGGGMVDLGTLGGNWSEAHGVSADGDVVVGWAENLGNYKRAFRWTQGNGMQDLGTLGGSSSMAYGVSADGSVVVGESQLSDLVRVRAFRWTSINGMQDNFMPNDRLGAAYGVSADGNTIVGTERRFSYGSGGDMYFYAFRWTATGGLQRLGTLGNYGSTANGVSANGEVIVGQYLDNTQYLRAFRWTQSSGMQDIGTLGGVWSEAYGTSADGSVVVGWAQDADGQPRAFRWTVGGGMQNLSTLYASLLTNGSYLRDARAISPDGRYIVGSGYNAATQRFEAYLLDTAPSCTPHNGDVNNNGCVDDADLLAVLFAFGQSGNALGRVDVNCDHSVDDADLLIVLFNFGSGC